MKVSVIIPVYNAEKYLRECIESIINQTYRNLEIICINDFSKDNSLMILEEYQRKDTRIKIINKLKNEGQMKARNDGYELSTGEFIVNIDSDDFIEEDSIEKMIDLLKKNKMADICIFDVLKIDENGEKVNNIEIKRKDVYVLKNLEAFELSLDWTIPGNGIYKRELMEEYKDDTNYYNGDELAYRKRILNSNGVIRSNKKYFYRQHQNSYVHKINYKVYEQIISDIELKNSSEKYLAKEILEKMEYFNFNKVLYFSRRYLKERREYSKNEREKIKLNLKKGMIEINRERVFNYYKKEGQLSKYLTRVLKLKIMKLKILLF